MNFGAEFPLDVVQVKPVIPVDQVDSKTKVAVTTRTADTVEIGFRVLREVKVDDNVNGLNIDTTGEEIRADEVAADAVAEIVEDAITSSLGHLGMAVEAGIAQLGDLLGEQLHAVGGVAEDNGLVDLQFGEEGVQAVHLLPLFNVGIVLSNTAEGELIHEVDLVGIPHVVIREGLDGDREGGGEEHDLTVFRMELEQLLDDRGELGRQKLVGLIHDEHGALAQIGNLLRSQIKDTPGSTDHNMDGVLQPDDIVTKPCSTRRDHNIDAEVLAKDLANLRCLHRQLASGDQN